MNWIILIISGLIIILMFLLSAPKHRVMTVVTLCLIGVSTAWQTYDSYTEERANKQIRSFVCKKLIVADNRFFSVLSDAIYRSSDGWLPINESEFFSERAANQICQRLNLGKFAPVEPEATWRNRLGTSCRDYRNTLNDILANYGSKLEPDLIKAVASAEQTTFLHLSEQMMLLPQVDREFGVVRPPLLCWGLEPKISESLNVFHILHNEINKLANELKLPHENTWLKFSENKDALGIDRFDDKAIANWEKEHPSTLDFGRFVPYKP
jgi:hypothetical protein